MTENNKRGGLERIKYTLSSYLLIILFTCILGAIGLILYLVYKSIADRNVYYWALALPPLIIILIKLTERYTVFLRRRFNHHLSPYDSKNENGTLEETGFPAAPGKENLSPENRKGCLQIFLLLICLCGFPVIFIKVAIVLIREMKEGVNGSTSEILFAAFLLSIAMILIYGAKTILKNFKNDSDQ